ncbi:MAG: hypothetical protein AB7Q17_15850 [Phycisphaerae bacterium]
MCPAPTQIELDAAVIVAAAPGARRAEWRRGAATRSVVIVVDSGALYGRGPRPAPGRVGLEARKRTQAELTVARVGDDGLAEPPKHGDTFSILDDDGTPAGPAWIVRGEAQDDDGLWVVTVERGGVGC